MMSENVTQDQNGARPFEERVIALLNDMRLETNARLDQLNERVTAIEAKSYDTKPIWERALAEITEMRREMNELRGEVNGLRRDVDELKIVTERGFRSVERKLDVFNQDLLDLRDSYRRLEDSLQPQR